MNNRDDEFNLFDLFSILTKRWWVILLILVVCVGVAGVVSLYVLEPIYQADTTLYIGRDVETQGVIAYEDLLVGDRLVNDYRELVKSRLVTGLVIKELNLSFSSDQLANTIVVTSIQNTRLIKIMVEDLDPNQAALIANVVANTFVDQAVGIMKVDNVQIIDVAHVPGNPSKPNVRMNIAIALIFGLMLGIAMVILIDYFDRTLKTSDDIKKYLELPVIGLIPYYKKL